MPFASECLEIAPACEEQMLGREGLPLLGEAGIFLTGLSRVRDHYLIRRNRPEFHILMVSHDEGGALLTDEGEQAIPAGSLIFLPAAVPGGLKLIGESWQISWILLDDVPRWQHLHRLGHRIWQGDGGDQLYHLLSLMQGKGFALRCNPNCSACCWRCWSAPCKGRCAAPLISDCRLCFAGWRRAWTNPGVSPCWPDRWLALYPICTGSVSKRSVWGRWRG